MAIKRFGRESEPLYLAIAEYDFSVGGGGTAGVPIGLGTKLPKNAILVASIVDILTAVTSANGNSGNLSINVETAADIKSAAATSGAFWSNTGQKAGSLTWGSFAKTTAEREITTTPTAEVLTAGKFVAYVLWMPGTEA